MGRGRWHTLKHTPTHPLIIYTLSMVEGEGGGHEGIDTVVKGMGGGIEQ